MTSIDYLIILLYFVGLLILGATVGRRIKSSKEMFIAGRNSSWWLSGLSTYMTIFSAGTFVVWGGVAYRSGVVAIVVGLMLGFASLLVGLFLAGKWSRMRINSPAEYLGIRFGKPTIRFYTVFGMIGKGVHTAVALYAVAIMAVALMPLPEGHFLADPRTGHLSITCAVIVLGLITFVYTAAGGFLAVLMTDVVQFAILIAMILIMIPLSFNSVGGVQEFIAKAPPEYFSLFTSQYSWVWMILWCLLHAFMIGGDWAFVQRYISVPTPRDAKKSVFLVAGLYFVTPLFFYVPALVYRVINPDANPEQAYMLMSQYILTTGMLGMMMAAMLSATMSMVSGTLNVYANVFTYDIFKSLRPQSTDRTLMRVGRVFTFIYGSLITLVAILIPFLGGAERVVVSFLTLVISPLFIPSIWGLFSKRIGQKSVFISMGITFGTAILVKAGLLFPDVVSRHPTFVDAFIGLVFPVTILTILELILWKKPQAEGFLKIAARYKKEDEVLTAEQIQKNKQAGAMYSNMAFKIMMGTYAAIGLAMVLLALGNKDDRGSMLLYGGIFLGLSTLAFLLYHGIRAKRKNSNAG
ncbi:SSS family solute:Na+ symporter [Ereboglobus sp. PH5-10]|uniref:sodium:solute symporter family transporter n=1 Tax=Ereboglobus sp. PH5-10 TaxID=2940629 RepID=UPI002405FBC1|nr:hypothetical protein [Ereboglobus sp. PH5-10]MDF9825965.1 SSS family solute:Na+ symporter [Ereboglobus sp. PH5-10]